jgi:hypothetical protein
LRGNLAETPAGYDGVEVNMPAILVVGIGMVVAFVLLGLLFRRSMRRAPHHSSRGAYASPGDSSVMFLDGGSSSDCGPGDAGCGDGAGGGDGGGGGGGD